MSNTDKKPQSTLTPLARTVALIAVCAVSSNFAVMGLWLLWKDVILLLDAWPRVTAVMFGSTDPALVFGFGVIFLVVSAWLAYFGTSRFWPLTPSDDKTPPPSHTPIKWQFIISTLMMLTGFVAVGIMGIIATIHLQDDRKFTLWAYVHSIIRLSQMTGPYFVPVVFAAYGVGRKRFTAAMLVVFAVAQGIAVWLSIRTF